MKDKKNIITVWNVADVYLKQLLTYIDKTYEHLSDDNYAAAYKRVQSITSFSAYYINAKKKQTSIKKLLETAEKPTKKDYLTLKRNGEYEECEKILDASKVAIHEIIEEINIIFCSLGSFVPVTTKPDSITESMKM